VTAGRNASVKSLNPPACLRTLLPAMLAVLVAGCATSRDVRSADGWMTHVVSCGGPILNMGHCIEKAGEICGARSYTVLNAQGGEVPKDPNTIPTGGLPDIPKSMDKVKTDFSAARTLYIKCH